MSENTRDTQGMQVGTDKQPDPRALAFTSRGSRPSHQGTRTAVGAQSAQELQELAAQTAQSAHMLQELVLSEVYPYSMYKEVEDMSKHLVVSAVKGSNEAQASLGNIFQYIKSRGEPIPHFKFLFGGITGTMAAYPDVVGIQVVAVQVFRALLVRWPHGKDSHPCPPDYIVASDALDTIHGAIALHPTSIGFIDKAFQFFHSLCDFSETYTKKVLESGGYEAALAVLAKAGQEKAKQVYRFLMRVLSSGAEAAGEQHVAKFIESNGIKTVVDNVKKYISCEDVVMAGVNVLIIIVNDDKTNLHPAQRSLIEHIFAFVLSHRGKANELIYGIHPRRSS